MGVVPVHVVLGHRQDSGGYGGMVRTILAMLHAMLPRHTKTDF
jgi:hypothetical protein